MTRAAMLPQQPDAATRARCFARWLLAAAFVVATLCLAVPAAGWLMAVTPPSVYDVVTTDAQCLDAAASAHAWCMRT